MHVLRNYNFDNDINIDDINIDIDFFGAVIVIVNVIVKVNIQS